MNKTVAGMLALLLAGSLGITQGTPAHAAAEPTIVEFIKGATPVNGKFPTKIDVSMLCPTAPAPVVFDANGIIHHATMSYAGQVNGFETYTGAVSNNTEISIAAVKNNNSAAIWLHDGSKAYTVLPYKDQYLMNYQTRPRDFADELDGPGKQQEPDIAPFKERENKTIKAMYVYTQASVDAVGGEDQLKSRLALGWMINARVHEFSKTQAQFQLVTMYKTTAKESATTRETLDHYTGAHPDWQDARNERIRLEADLVQLWTTDYNGLGWLMYQPAVYGVSIVNYDLVSGYGLGPAHEFGHNFNLKHDRYEVDKKNPSRPTGYRYGYSDPNCVFVTVMAYPNECNDKGKKYPPRLPAFSSDTVSYRGARLGNAGANNARAAQENRSKVANFFEQWQAAGFPVYPELPKS